MELWEPPPTPVGLLNWFDFMWVLYRYPQPLRVPGCWAVEPGVSSTAVFHALALGRGELCSHYTWANTSGPQVGVMCSLLTSLKSFWGNELRMWSPRTGSSLHRTFTHIGCTQSLPSASESKRSTLLPQQGWPLSEPTALQASNNSPSDWEPLTEQFHSICNDGQSLTKTMYHAHSKHSYDQWPPGSQGTLKSFSGAGYWRQADLWPTERQKQKYYGPVL